MSHYRGIRAQRMTAPRNGAEFPMSDEEQVDPYFGDVYHTSPCLPDHPISSGKRQPMNDAQQEQEPWHS